MMLAAHFLRTWDGKRRRWLRLDMAIRVIKGGGEISRTDYVSFIQSRVACWLVPTEWVRTRSAVWTPFSLFALSQPLIWSAVDWSSHQARLAVRYWRCPAWTPKFLHQPLPTRCTVHANFHVAGYKLACFFPGVDGRPFREPIIFVINRIRWCRSESSRPPTVGQHPCLMVMMPPGRLRMGSA